MNFIPECAGQALAAELQNEKCLAADQTQSAGPHHKLPLVSLGVISALNNVLLPLRGLGRRGLPSWAVALGKERHTVSLL